MLSKFGGDLYEKYLNRSAKQTCKAIKNSSIKTNELKSSYDPNYEFVRSKTLSITENPANPKMIDLGSNDFVDDSFAGKHKVVTYVHS